MSEMTDVCKRYGISAKWTDGPELDVDAAGWEHYGGKVRLSYVHTYRDMSKERHQLTVAYKVGTGIDPETVTAADVCASLVLDAYSGALDFSDFCAEYGYNEDSIRARETWQACRSIGKRWDNFCRSQAMLDDFANAEH